MSERVNKSVMLYPDNGEPMPQFLKDQGMTDEEFQQWKDRAEAECTSPETQAWVAETERKIAAGEFESGDYS